MNHDKTRISIAANRPAIGPSDACIVRIYGGDLGRRYPLTEEITVGRDDDNTIVIELDNVSRRHARFFPLSDACYVADLGSTNGTQVNDVDVRGSAALSNGDLIKVGGAIFKFISGGNVEALYHEEIYRMTIIDGLTQIHNKRYFLDFLEREMARSLRRRRALALLLFDIDHFKVLNDNYGHLAGDYVLRKMAELISRHVRREELFARYGGEEFALVLPETDGAGAELFGEKIRALVEATVFEFDDERIHTTISVGVAVLTESCEPLDFIKAADDHLYRAKDEGRNRVVSG